MPIASSRSNRKVRSRRHEVGQPAAFRATSRRFHLSSGTRSASGGPPSPLRPLQTIKLFENRPDRRRTPISLAASILIHGAAIALVAFAVLYAPRIDHRLSDRYSVRQLDLNNPDEPVHRSAASSIAYPGPRPPARSAAPSAAGKQSAQSLVLPPIPHTRRGPQTLVQPDIKTDVTLAQTIPVPQVILWTPASRPVPKIVAPLPVKPPKANVKPTLEKPNAEPRLGDIALTSSTQPSLKQLAVPATTTPLVLRTPQVEPQVQSPPSTVSQIAAKPTPAAVISLSDVKMKSGTVTLPPVNESSATDNAGAVSLNPGQAKSPSAPGATAPGTKAAVNGPGNGSGSSTANNSANGKTGANQNPGGSNTAQASASPSAGNGQIPGNGSGTQTQSPDTGANFGAPPANTTLISLPPDGHFGSIIVGNSVQDEFPEINDVWKGRMAYTVYLHVGLQKSWILQYSLPRTVDASEAGAVTHLDAPWPYTIVRPNLPTDAIDADALMIHGYVNGNGRFETLSVVFPPQFAQAKFVVDSLQHWQFRPALQNGQVAKVEVLLIIPEEFE